MADESDPERKRWGERGLILDPPPDQIERIDFLETMVSKERLDGAHARVAEAEARLEVAKVRLERTLRDHARVMKELGVKYQMPEGTTVLEDGRIVRS